MAPLAVEFLPYPRVSPRCLKRLSSLNRRYRQLLIIYRVSRQFDGVAKVFVEVADRREDRYEIATTIYIL